MLTALGKNRGAARPPVPKRARARATERDGVENGGAGGAGTVSVIGCWAAAAAQRECRGRAAGPGMEWEASTVSMKGCWMAAAQRECHPGSDSEWAGPGQSGESARREAARHGAHARRRQSTYRSFK